MATEATTVINAVKKNDALDRLNQALDQTAAWMLELTRLKKEIEREEHKKNFILIK